MEKNYVLASILGALATKQENGTKLKAFTAKGNRELNKKLNEDRKNK